MGDMGGPLSSASLWRGVGRSPVPLVGSPSGDVFASIQAILDNYELPLRFGAKFDGTTDDSAALQKAHDKNGVLALPQGKTAGVGATINLASGSHIIGQQTKSILTPLGSFAGPMFKANSLRSDPAKFPINLQGFRVNGGSMTTFLSTRDCQGLNVRDVYIYGGTSWTDVFNVQFTWSVIFDNVKVWAGATASRCALYLADSANSVHLRGFYTSMPNTPYGVYVDTGTSPSGVIELSGGTTLQGHTSFAVFIRNLLLGAWDIHGCYFEANNGTLQLGDRANGWQTLAGKFECNKSTLNSAQAKHILASYFQSLTVENNLFDSIGDLLQYDRGYGFRWGYQYSGSAGADLTSRIKQVPGGAFQNDMHAIIHNQFGFYLHANSGGGHVFFPLSITAAGAVAVGSSWTPAVATA